MPSLRCIAGHRSTRLNRRTAIVLAASLTCLGALLSSPLAWSVERTGAGDTNSSASLAYANATSLVDDGRYTEALAAYRKLQRDFPTYKRLPAVQTRIAVLVEARDAGPSLSDFLAALDHRDSGDVDQAIARLDTLIDTHSDSSLLDDALYLKA